MRLWALSGVILHHLLNLLQSYEKKLGYTRKNIHFFIIMLTEAEIFVTKQSQLHLPVEFALCEQILIPAFSDKLTF